MTPLLLSAQNDQLDCLTFLIDQKAKVNARDNQNNTPLHILGHNNWFSNKFCLRAAEELIKAGADLTAVNNIRKTPMDNVSVKKLQEQKLQLFPGQLIHVQQLRESCLLTSD
jgi:ankyrin repeat protein